MQNKGVIVLGGHIQALTIVRICGINKIPCIVINDTGINLARYSKYCSRFIKGGNTSLLDILFNLTKDGDYNNWILLPTNDYQVEILSKNKKRLSKYFIVGTDSWENVSDFYSKDKTYSLAKSINIPVPETIVTNSIEDLNSVTIGFPCIIKPTVMHIFHREYRKKVFYCNSFEELKDIYNKVKTDLPGLTLMIQEIIDGSYDVQYSAGVFAIKGETVNCIAAKRVRQHPLKFGNATTCAETIEDPGFLEYARDIIKANGFTGLCEVEFIFCKKSNSFKLLEVNPRTWKWHGIQLGSKTPFVTNYINFLSNNPVEKKLTWEKATWVHTTTDLYARALIKIRKLHLHKSKAKYHSYALRNIKDPLPSFMEIIFLPYLFLTRF